MPDEYTPEIQEPEFSDEKQVDLPTVTGPETAEQLFGSWVEHGDVELPVLEESTEAPTDVQAVPLPSAIDGDASDELPEDLGAVDRTHRPRRWFVDRPGVLHRLGAGRHHAPRRAGR